MKLFYILLGIVSAVALVWISWSGQPLNGAWILAGVGMSVAIYKLILGKVK